MLAKVMTLRMGFSLLWLAIVGAGFALLLNYQSASGHSGPAPGDWPKTAQIAPDAKRSTLVMFVHPQCPCTRASMEELNHLLARHHGQVAVQVMFVQPGELTPKQMQGVLWQSATAMPDVTARIDTNGVQAALFGAETSGYVLLYDAQRRLIFRGGITDGRGHAGDNAGEEAIDALLDGEMVKSRQTPVYGCSLLDAPALAEGNGK